MAYYALIAPAQQWQDANGNPRSGYKLFQYEAGTSAKKTSYTDDTGAVANANPIILDSSGMCPSGVFGTTGAYKLVLAPPTDSDPPLSPVWTRDGIAGINDVSASVPSEWITFAIAPVYISASSFSLIGDQTATFQLGRRVKATLSGATRYGFITSSSFGAGITTVVMSLDSGSLDSSLSAVAYGLLAPNDPSIPTVWYNNIPIGAIIDYAGTATPQGYLACDGANVSRTTYAKLFTAIATTWGVGDGSTTFGLPDFRRRVAVGSGGTGTGTLGNAIGNTGGAETVNLQHLHAVSITTGVASSGTVTAVGGGGNNVTPDHTHLASGNTANALTTTQTIMQPSAIVGKFIRYAP